MEFQFQQPQDKQNKLTERGNKIKASSSPKSKFLGVRQRPSGKWVAEIKNTTQKIRIWLGTFDTAEEAARAYDEAACLLRGSNTRTNFVPSNNSNSALSRRIRNLVNQKKSLINSQSVPTPSITTPTTKTADIDHASSGLVPSSIISIKGQMLDENPYRLDTSGQFDYSWAFRQQLLPMPDDFGLVPKHISFTPNPEITNEATLPEFERMKVERQISASLYAMNGVNDYLESVFDVCNSSDPTTPSWDLPMLYPPFCLG